MDTIRTLYLSSATAQEKNGTYTYDLKGGIAVPEGARVFVDNVSFTNTFSEEVTEDNRVLYLQAFESSSVSDPGDKDFTFAYNGIPAKDLLHSNEVVLQQPFLQANLPSTTWSDGTTTYKFTAASRDEFVLDKSDTPCKIFCYNVTKDRFFFHFDWLGNGTTTSGVFNSGVIHLGAQ